MKIVGTIKKQLNKIALVRYAYVFLVKLSGEGLGGAWRATARQARNDRWRVVKEEDRRRLRAIVGENRGKTIIVSCPLIDWHVPLFQRPQHIAAQLSRRGFLYFYSTFNCLYDDVAGFHQIEQGLYLTNHFELVREVPGGKIIHLCSTDNITSATIISEEIEKGSLIVYEYIDEIHDKVSGVKIPESTYRRHEMILRDERCIVVATADKLYREVLAYRSKRCALVTNGVDVAHFSQTFSVDQVPVEIRPLITEGKPIIGYFGALASWFDYELVCRLAAERPEYSILLIGWNYDRTMDVHNLGRFRNLHVIGPIQYQELPRYAYWFDIATIPFLINEITESTSPIKLFEYMALGKPIVTTAMPECRKYESVLIGEDHDDFIARLDQAMLLRDDETYRALLKREALENTWEAKAAVVARLIRENLPVS